MGVVNKHKYMNIWIYMDIYEYEYIWICMDIYGYIWMYGRRITAPESRHLETLSAKYDYRNYNTVSIGIIHHIERNFSTVYPFI